MKEPNAMSFHVKYKPEDFMPANEEEKQSQVISVRAWASGRMASADFVRIRLPWSASSLLL